MSLSHRYYQLIADNVLTEDPYQEAAVLLLARLSEKLHASEGASPSFWHNFRRKRTITDTQGFYFYGRVGRGKTLLMDLFYQHLNITRKKRIHFHHFMESVHLSLKMYAGQEEPLKKIAAEWIHDIDVLCFDEFFVTDIADAMLMAGLFEHMFANGVMLIATSNCTPEQLYWNGLQRERFLPTIHLINRYCQVISIDGDNDYRRAVYQRLYDSQQEYRYYFFDENTKASLLKHCFSTLVGSSFVQDSSIEVLKRNIECIARTENIIWFEFLALCSSPRSQRDYIKIADQYKTVVLSNVPQFSGKRVTKVALGVEDQYQRNGQVMAELCALDDEARRFIALVDELYDRNICLVISAEVDIAELYQGRQLAFEFARCQSRLYEMQCRVY